MVNAAPLPENDVAVKTPDTVLLPDVNASAFPAVIPDQLPQVPVSLKRIDNVGFVTFLGNPN